MCKIFCVSIYGVKGTSHNGVVEGVVISITNCSIRFTLLYFTLLILSLLLLLLHDLYRANFENRVRGAGVARWRT